MKATLLKTEPQAADIMTFWFEPEKPLRYIAGQFIEMYLPHDQPDDRGTKRWFTLSSSPTEPQIAITTRFAHTPSTFKQQLTALMPGDSVQLSEPMGDFVLPLDSSIPLVFVAGGIGVTPFRSMLKWLHDKDESRDVILLLAAKHAQDFAFLPELDDWGVIHSQIVSDDTANWPGLKGHITPEIITQMAGDLANKRVYLSGPEPMVEMLVNALRGTGLSEDQIIGDYFPGYQPI